MTGCKVYLFNHSLSDIVLAAGTDRTIQVFDMNQGCMVTQIPDAHCRAVHHLTQNKVREWRAHDRSCSFEWNGLMHYVDRWFSTIAPDGSMWHWRLE